MPAAICSSTPNKTAFQDSPSCELSRIEQQVVAQPPVEVQSEVSAGVNQTEVVVVNNCDKDKQQGTETGEQRMDIDENDNQEEEKEETVVVVPVSVCVVEDKSRQEEYTAGGILTYSSPLDHMELNRCVCMMEC